MTTEAPHLDLSAGDATQLAASRAEERRHAAMAVVSSLFRLVKICRIHVESNQAVKSVMESTAAAVATYCEKTDGQSVSVLFSTDTVFVNGQMLRASRETYQMAMEFGGWLEKLKLSEVTFARTTDLAALTAFARAFMGALRDHTQVAALPTLQIPGIRMRQLRVHAGREAVLEESPAGRLVRTYAAAIVVVRQFYEAVDKGAVSLPPSVKRVAQRLVATAEERPQALVALTAARANPKDPASVAVSQAMVAMLIARQLTSDRVLLSGLVLAALLADAGAARVSRGAADDSLAGVRRSLSEADDGRVPVSSIVMSTALGRIHAPAIQRAVLVFEALWAERDAKLGPVYAGRRPATLLARVLTTARRFQSLVSGLATGAPMTIDEALQHLTNEASDENERTEVKLLTGALGIFPAGTIVELSTGEMGVVLATPTLPIDFARPPVRILYDEHGQKLPEPLDVDLAAVPPGEAARVIRRTVEADEQQMKAMRAYVMTVAANRRASRAITNPNARAGATPAVQSIRPSAPPGRTPPPSIAARGSAPPAHLATPPTRVDRAVSDRTPSPASMPPAARGSVTPPPRSGVGSVTPPPRPTGATPAPRPVMQPPPSVASRPAPPLSVPSTPASSTRAGSRPPAAPVDEVSIPEPRREPSAPDSSRGEAPTALGRVKVQRVAVPAAPPSHPGAVEERVTSTNRPAPTQHVDWATYNPLVSATGDDAAELGHGEPPPSSRGESWASGLEVVGPAEDARAADRAGAKRAAAAEDVALEWALPELERPAAPGAATQVVEWPDGPSDDAAPTPRGDRTRRVSWDQLDRERPASPAPPRPAAQPVPRTPQPVPRTSQPVPRTSAVPAPRTAAAPAPRTAAAPAPRTTAAPAPGATRERRWSSTEAILREIDDGDERGDGGDDR